MYPNKVKFEQARISDNRDLDKNKKSVYTILYTEINYISMETKRAYITNITRVS